MSVFDDLSSLPLLRIWADVGGRAVHGERITLGVVELAAGSVVPEHSHDNEQVGICLAGALRFRIGDETAEVTPGTTYVIGPNVPHEVEWVGPDGAVVVDVFGPPREDWKPLPELEARPPRWP